MRDENLFWIEKDKYQVGVNSNDGQVKHIIHQETEYKHPGGGENAWTRSGLDAFPIFGPTNDMITFNGHRFPMTQHGLLRILKPQVKLDNTLKSIFVHWNYNGEPIQNNTNKGPKQLQFLPFAFSRLESFDDCIPCGEVDFATGNHLKTKQLVQNTSQEEMRCGMGAHDSFKILGNVKDNIVILNNETHKLTDILEEIIKTGDALEKPNCGTMALYNTKLKQGIKLMSRTYNNSLLWTANPKNPAHLCLEFVDYLPNEKKSTRGDFDIGYGYTSLKPGEMYEHEYITKVINNHSL